MLQDSRMIEKAMNWLCMIEMSYAVQHEFSANEPLDASTATEKHKKDQSDLRVGKDKPTLKLWCSDHDRLDHENSHSE